MQVFWVDHFGKDVPKMGESDMKRIDEDYVKVNGQLMNVAFVWPATDENLELYTTHLKRMNEWRKAEPNMYAVLNEMKR